MIDLLFDIPLLLAVGVAAGLLAGLLGIGGGVIIVPALIFLFEHQGMKAPHILPTAIGTSLATIVLTSLSSARAHQERGAIQWPTVRRIAAGLVLGAPAGAWLASVLPGQVLRMLFALFLLIVAVKLWWQPAQLTEQQPALRGNALFPAAGFVIGAVSSFFGIGGGTLSVPFLSWCNMPLKRAVASSAAIGVVISLFGVLGYIVTGWRAGDMPSLNVGYINLPAWFGITITSVFFAPLGAKLAHRMSPLILRRLFSTLLVGVSIKLMSNLL